MCKYELNESSNVVIREDNDGVISAIPIEPANSDYQRYLEHLTENPTA